MFDQSLGTCAVCRGSKRSRRHRDRVQNSGEGKTPGQDVRQRRAPADFLNSPIDTRRAAYVVPKSRVITAVGNPMAAMARIITGSRRVSPFRDLQDVARKALMRK
jgi:hypothetical protein